MSATPVDNPAAFNAVVDTNVVITIYSWHDFMDDADRLFTSNPAATLEHPELAYRRERARTAFRLMLFFNEQKWIVRSPLTETLRTLLARVSPDDAKGNFTKLFLYFLTELLPDWRVRSDPADDDGIVGDAVDLLCVAWAQEDRIPLISWEGHTPTGHNPKKLIPREAKARGVDLVTPEQLLERHKFVEESAAKRFLAAWDSRAEDFLKNRSDARELMELARHFFQRLADNDWGP